VHAAVVGLLLSAVLAGDTAAVTGHPAATANCAQQEMRAVSRFQLT